MASAPALKILQKNEKYCLTFAALYGILIKSAATTIEYGGIAQLGERLNGIQEVSGSIPLISTKKSWFSMKTMTFLVINEEFVLIGVPAPRQVPARAG